MVIMLTLQINIHLGGINTSGQIPRDAVSMVRESFLRASPEKKFPLSRPRAFAERGREFPRVDSPFRAQILVSSCLKEV